MTEIKHVYELRPRKDKRGVDLIFDALPFGRLWYAEPNAVANAISVKLAAPDKGVGERSIYDTPHMTLVFLTFNVGVLAAQL
jgi:hypothetical protein